MNTTLEPTPKIIRAHEGEYLALRGEIRHQLLNSNDTGGAFSLARSNFQCGTGSPHHVHTLEDEWFWVQSGEFQFKIGEALQNVRAGDFVFGPRGVFHSYTCQSEEGGTLLIGVSDAGFENFFREVATMSENGGGPTPDQMRAIAERYGVHFGNFMPPQSPVTAPKIVRSGDGVCLEAFGDSVRVLVSTAESGGRFCVAETQTPSFMGPPPHVHERENEMFFILAGRYEFQIGDARVQAEPGDVVFAPRGVPHTFRVVSAEPGRFLLFAVPGGFDVFFEECARLFQSGQATPAGVGQIGAAHGLRFLMPSP